MDAESMRLLAKALIILSMMPTAVAEGWVVAKTMEAMGRNPEAANSLFSKMIVGVATVESTAIYALVAFFLV